jgi:superfamily II DNA or RNA helicase
VSGTPSDNLELPAGPLGEPDPETCLEVILDATLGVVRWDWLRRTSGQRLGHGRIELAELSILSRFQALRWHADFGFGAEEDSAGTQPTSIHALVRRILKIHPVPESAIRLGIRLARPLGELVAGRDYPLVRPAEVPPGIWIGRFLADFEQLSRHPSAFGGTVPEGAIERGRGALQRLIELRVRSSPKPAPGPPPPVPPPPKTARPPAPAPPPRKPAPRPPPPEAARAPREPAPPVAVRLETPPLALQDTAFTISDLRSWFLREQAARWWVSNQSDDLLALPYCRIRRLDYQVRTALRVIGPLRGRALLSDEVGLGKTIEAGLVLKEWLTRGMVQRFLILTVPSLVDQWEEELSEKFDLTVATTNRHDPRADGGRFWREHPGIVASLSTLKQPAHLEVARSVPWDLIIVDEAHHLRNRDSQAWQAVSVLPRRFLLLLTATPVQNSLEELYNLVTLLQPGQFPSPREFRARFIDPKRPRQPREPDELRRLLGQIMVRNTRANAGINLPPRHAETVLFDPTPEEAAFHDRWERELRVELARLQPGLASLWGRLLLQAFGSSPAAWSSALERFPVPKRARDWRAALPGEASWRRKCQLLVPLLQGDGGVVVFTQFRETQAALAEVLRVAGHPVWVVNGSTPARDRQPITESFRTSGGALLLTHCGTEGRNLQFCHRLVNFDLPWNPMEIEQRIGRLHRLGQERPVRIHNFVQAGSLQEHLLSVLQEKLNLFELVVGEAGLVLGERFGADEFAEEVLRRWRDSEGRVAQAIQDLGQELASARDGYRQIQDLDRTLFSNDYEALP